MTRPIKSTFAARTFSNQEQLWDWYDNLVDVGNEITGTERDALAALLAERHQYPQVFSATTRFDVAANHAGYPAIRCLTANGDPRFVLNKMRLTRAARDRLAKPEVRMLEAMAALCDSVSDAVGHHREYWAIRGRAEARCPLTGLAMVPEFSIAVPAQNAWSPWKLAKWCATQFRTPPAQYFQQCETADRSEFIPSVHAEICPFVAAESASRCAMRVVHVLGRLLVARSDDHPAPPAARPDQSD